MQQYIGETVQVFTFQKFTFSWNYLQYKTTACEKNNSHAMYHIPGGVRQNYSMSANNKVKFRIVGLRDRL